MSRLLLSNFSDSIFDAVKLFIASSRYYPHCLQRGAATFSFIYNTESLLHESAGSYMQLHDSSNGVQLEVVANSIIQGDYFVRFRQNKFEKRSYFE